MTTTLYTTDNRIARAIADLHARIEELPLSKQAVLEATTVIDFQEHFAYQRAQSAAFSDGTITADEAQLIYAALGQSFSDNNGGWAAQTDLATKMAVTQAISELLGRRLAQS